MKKIFAWVVALCLLVSTTAVAYANGTTNFIPSLANSVFPADTTASDFYYNSGSEVHAVMALVLLLDYAYEVKDIDLDHINYREDTYFGVNTDDVFYVMFHDIATNEAIDIMYMPSLNIASYNVTDRGDYTYYADFMMESMCSAYEHIDSNSMVIGEAYLVQKSGLPLK